MPQHDEPKSVLIVEDEVLIAMHLGAVIEDAGYRVCGMAPDAAAALEMAAASPPDIAVVDIRLGPGPDGIALAHDLRARHDCPILFVSGSAEPATMVRTREVARSAFLQKPVDPDLLTQRLRELLADA